MVREQIIRAAGLVIFGAICAGLGSFCGSDRDRKQAVVNLREWRTIDASGNLMFLGKLRADINAGKFEAASKLIEEQIAANQGVLREFEGRMGKKERYYADGAAFTLETGLYPNEIFHAEGKNEPDWDAIRELVTKQQLRQ